MRDSDGRHCGRVWQCDAWWDGSGIRPAREQKQIKKSETNHLNGAAYSQNRRNQPNPNRREKTPNGKQSQHGIRPPPRSLRRHRAGIKQASARIHGGCSLGRANPGGSEGTPSSANGGNRSSKAALPPRGPRRGGTRIAARVERRGGMEGRSNAP